MPHFKFHGGHRGHLFLVYISDLNLVTGAYFSKILIKIQNFSFTKMYLKIPSAKRRPFCPEGDEFCILIKISLKFVPKDQIENYTALVQIMTWRGINQCWPDSLTHIYGTTTGRWIKLFLSTMYVYFQTVGRLLANEIGLTQNRIKCMQNLKYNHIDRYWAQIINWYWKNLRTSNVSGLMKGIYWIIPTGSHL